jgi:hypothetical protein
MSLTTIKELLSHNTIDIEEVISIVQELINNASQDSYEDGLDAGFDSAYDQGYDDGQRVAKAEWETQRDEWFEQGWAEALLEHGIEE